MVIILDYGMGNLGAHLNMMRKIGFDAVKVSANLDDLEKAEKIIIPGVGSFDAGMKNLSKPGLIEVLRFKALEQKVPVLGICLGMHLFANGSEEGNTRGLGWIDTSVVRFKFNALNEPLKIPHMGWNTVKMKKESVLFNGMMEQENRFYFVHSYHMDAFSDRYIVATSNYGYDFPAAVQKDNIFGVQFHPEKSHKFGLRLYKNFIEA